MRLHDHPDFAAFITAAATAEGADLGQYPEQFVEKDYWITESLRVMQATLHDRLIFKGGTSLSKGWDILPRFSEDIDLFVDPAVDPPLSKRAVDRQLKELRTAVLSLGGLEVVDGQTWGGKGRVDTVRYVPQFDEVPGFPPTVRLEPGVQSGKQPTSIRTLSSFVGAYLIEQGVTASQLEVEEFGSFEMRLLHFRRTFIEKLFALHNKVERLKTEQHALGRDARHYADVFLLSQQSAVLEMLDSGEYAEICEDYDRLSREHFPTTYRSPPGGRIQHSDAIALSGELLEQVRDDYERECTRLFYRPHPPFDAVVERLTELRPKL